MYVVHAANHLYDFWYLKVPVKAPVKAKAAPAKPAKPAPADDSDDDSSDDSDDSGVSFCSAAFFLVKISWGVKCFNEID